MANNDTIDFYEIGLKKVHDKYSDTKKYAEMIEKEYGKDARLQYECGMAVAFNQISSSETENLAQYLYTTGTKDIGVPNQRNNSYFGKTGISNQFDEDGVYIDPDKTL